MELRAENISKIIHKKTILSNVNLELHNGTVYGFVGAFDNKYIFGDNLISPTSINTIGNVFFRSPCYLEWKSITS